MSISPNTDIQFLKGVGPKRSQIYAKLAIKTIKDILYHFPRAYIDISVPCTVSNAPWGESIAIKGRVIKKTGEQRIRKGLSVFKVLACDESAAFVITFFNAKFTVDSLKCDEEYIFYGKVGGTVLHREMAAPQIFNPNSDADYIAVYPLTAGISLKMLSSNIQTALSLLEDEIPDPLPKQVRNDYGLCSLSFALRNIHIPQSKEALQAARRRMIFEELFVMSVAMHRTKQTNSTKSTFVMKNQTMEDFYCGLGFELTQAQKSCIEEILSDLCSPKTMNRIIQGDVGSGKTAVAAAGMYFSAKNGYQSAMMVPTEILAEQHFDTLSNLLNPFGIGVELLTGSLTPKKKQEVIKRLVSGESMVCVGTNALISKNVEFKNLALVITDEQHRFGVAQRTRLSQKSENPHVLVMSATPIPRTLALIVYGDLDISVIDKLPLGRKPIKTYVISPDKRQRAFGFIKKHLDEGYQAYIVCPLIETGEVDMGLSPVKDYANEISGKDFCGYSVGVLHGKMKQQEKDLIMSKFKSGEIQLIVSTTVIEVGVDVPNSVIMMIEDADRFGLSQLHQLRGRVGRGNVQSHCILVTSSKSIETRKRLEVMCKTNDGFEIAKYDLEQRGPGEFLGQRQHGVAGMAIADIAHDTEILKEAQKAAEKIVNISLDKNEKDILDEYVMGVLSDVGEKLN